MVLMKYLSVDTLLFQKEGNRIMYTDEFETV